jgi:hypothetical protein
MEVMEVTNTPAVCHVVLSVPCTDGEESKAGR